VGIDRDLAIPADFSATGVRSDLSVAIFRVGYHGSGVTMPSLFVTIYRVVAAVSASRAFG
jgi:hypothetical protein